MKTYISYPLLLIFILLFCIISLQAQEKKKGRNAEQIYKEKEQAEKTATKPEVQLHPMGKAIAGSKKYEGLFTFYQDTTNGNIQMLVRENQLNKEYIYFSHIVDGPAETSSFRGRFMDNKIFSLRKYFNRIDFVHENTNFYFDPNNPLNRAAGANISPAVMSSQPIVALNAGKGEYLIKVDDVFLSEVLQPIKPIPNPQAKPGETFSLGNLNKEKSKYVRLKNYPLNTELTVDLIYDNPAPFKQGSKDITDSRSVSIKVQHSLIEMPKNNFQSRYEDPRIGYFTDEVNDLTSPEVVNYRDAIHRWHLEKKEKGAALSEPVEPIVFWIENTTPLEIRETIKKAGLTWNEAFEKAGFKNAIQIKIQPDDADWEAGDIRYNVLRWTASPSPLFGGYGPSYFNPRTGQILGADIMLEYTFLTNRTRQAKLYEPVPALTEAPLGPDNFCSLGSHLDQNTQFGQAALVLMDANETVRKEFVESALYFLIIHEIGHTLGLNHNMKSSHLYSPLDVHNKELTSKTGLMGSIMDYPAVNISKNRTKQGQYYSMKPGPYDVWAIAYGYTEALTDQKAEKQRLDAILARSIEPQLMFGNDADDMRSPGGGIDPRVMVNDMSSDAIAYSNDRIVLTNSLMQGIKTRYTATPNQSYQELTNVYQSLLGGLHSSAQVISRYIGGVYVDRSYTGQKTDFKPFMPVAYQDQKRAMQSLQDNIFSPKAIQIPGDIFNYLQMQRRGFTHFGKPEDPKVNDMVLGLHKTALDHLLHPVVLKRVTDSELYGNTYKLPELMSDLTKALFKEDLKTKTNSFRQNLQGEYVNRLIMVAGLQNPSSYDHPAQSQAAYQLKAIRKQLKANRGADEATQAHRQHLVFRINKAFEIK